MIYLASPHSHPNRLRRKERVDRVCAKAAEMMLAGEHVFSPIAHSANISRFVSFSDDWEDWKWYDTWFLSRCDKLVVLKLEGWKDSVGVQAEIKIAEGLGIPIEYMEET